MVVNMKESPTGTSRSNDDLLSKRLLQQEDPTCQAKAENRNITFYENSTNDKAVGVNNINDVYDSVNIVNGNINVSTTERNSNIIYECGINTDDDDYEVERKRRKLDHPNTDNDGEKATVVDTTEPCIVLTDETVGNNEAGPSVTDDQFSYRMIITSDQHIQGNNTAECITKTSEEITSTISDNTTEFIFILRVQSPEVATQVESRRNSRSRSRRRRPRRTRNSQQNRIRRVRQTQNEVIFSTEQNLGEVIITNETNATEAATSIENPTTETTVAVGDLEVEGEVEDVEYESLSPDNITRPMSKTWRTIPKYKLTPCQTAQQEADLYYTFLHETKHEKIRPAEDGEKQCCVCYDNQATRVITPCGHQCLCYECAKSIAFNRSTLAAGRIPKKCPICQAVIASMIRPL